MPPSSTLALKIKSKSGQHILKEPTLSLESKLSDLLPHLSALTAIDPSCIQIRSGFPPALVESKNTAEAIGNLGIKNGDTLIVEESKPCSAVVESSKTEGGSTKIEGGINTEQRIESNESKHHVVEETQPAQRGGVLLRRVVPSDNSCLFTSIGFVLNGKVDTTVGSYMRQIIAESISSDKEQYCDAILGKPNSEYVQWILKSESWGGAIELSILATFYGVEIAVIDTMNQIINRFGEDQGFPHRVYLIFDGIHYDPIFWEPSDMRGDIQTIFPTSNEEIYRDAERLAQELKQSKQYTDVKRFVLKCLDCNKTLTGQAEATQHAKSTGHTNFDECNS
uniref:Ubiquitin thioesterase OTU n=1 Tax=Cacopsylla melanoneura TaxID=428564 RepID=A0A8D8TEQ1_9HEMI